MGGPADTISGVIVDGIKVHDARRVAMIIDDDEQLCRGLLALLATAGHRGVWMPSGTAGLKRLRAEGRKPDLVILDALMPDVDGGEVLRVIRHDPATARLPVVIYSGVSDDAFRDHLLALGADDYWPKATLSLKEVVARAARYLCPQNDAD